MGVIFVIAVVVSGARCSEMKMYGDRSFVLASQVP